MARATSLFDDDSEDDDVFSTSASMPLLESEAKKSSPPSGETVPSSAVASKKDPNRAEPTEKITPKGWLMLFPVTAASAVAATGYGAAMGIFRTLPIYIAGGFGIGVAPCAIAQEVVIAKSESIRTLTNKLRGQVNKLQDENEKLTSTVDQLEAAVDRTNDVEQKLTAITVRQGTNVDKFVGLVKENGRIVKELSRLVKAEASQQLIQVVMSVDRDGNFEIDDNELPYLVLRLKHQVENVHVDEKRFIAAVKRNPGIGGVLDIVMQLNSDDIPEEDAIFTIKDERLKKAGVK
mmetsp:Transcript_49123/g.72988  ORF Transcript_49123/g.72988 Transcript_49123/m.72988 type:complete len:292 (+) Transcript_49123:101-976(+)|eukprot:CAMPEP_0195507358 /NCGR_PEP_ID=MMETSP0794_2-20130614/824_1 /TAXON_ID=515487 /ORGANISM="Stephanopyxis turris, Strain CCMP 815" /LENGTH=291 /DNA_ID=CAMNT_0040634015 /DNA_START=95 /DNA_END=970 /DNA_ORIENTATION=-